jgi:hypothetical protein
MENMDKKECGGMCGGSCVTGGCGMKMGGCGCHGGKHCLIKMILKLIIVILIFWCGFKLGSITGAIRAEYGRGAIYDGAPWGMMRGGVAPVTPAQ